MSDAADALRYLVGDWQTSKSPVGNAKTIQQKIDEAYNKMMEQTYKQFYSTVTIPAVKEKHKMKVKDLIGLLKQYDQNLEINFRAKSGLAPTSWEAKQISLVSEVVKNLEGKIDLEDKKVTVELV